MGTLGDIGTINFVEKFIGQPLMKGNIKFKLNTDKNQLNTGTLK